ncbi:MAG TPA: SAM-dependent methyltransferase, partial [Lautropia sp.]|nr:SAM-dependent methyltransferase [Lautropia sp.]
NETPNPAHTAAATAGLPRPGPQAAAVSEELTRLIVAEIERAGGWIGFDRYMTMALYEPGLGYYSNGKPVFGPAGDFVTAPELTPLFGAALSRPVGSWLAACADGDPLVIEFGAGSGTLACHLLNALERQGFSRLRYQIVELSGDLRGLQQKTIAARVPQMAGQVEWLSALPDSFRGVVIGNEVLDAMPVRTFEWDGSRLSEVGVVADSDRLGWAGREADDSLLRLVAASGADREAWHLPYRSEVCPQQGAWLATVAAAMQSGAILLLDYGFPAAEYYHPQRVGGTLMSHYRHRSLTDPFLWPGLQDITAHVDFSRILAAAEAAGLQPLGYTSQARFLLNCGLLDELEALPRDEQRLWFSQAQAVQRLVSEAEMGELFKAIAFGKEMPASASLPGFVEGDRLAALR